MGRLNKAQIIGRLGGDPELRQVNGKSVTSFRVATDDGYRDASGEWVDKTEWHSVVAWGKLADAIAQRATKGCEIYVEGKLQTRQFEDKNGNERQITEIMALTFELPNIRRESNGGAPPHKESAKPERAAAPAARNLPPKPTASKPADDDFLFGPDDELPF